MDGLQQKEAWLHTTTYVAPLQRRNLFTRKHTLLLRESHLNRVKQNRITVRGGGEGT
jgi:hypothetical protein